MCITENSQLSFVSTPCQVQGFHGDLERASLVCVDANIPEDTLKYVCELCWDAGVPGT